MQSVNPKIRGEDGKLWEMYLSFPLVGTCM